MTPRPLPASRPAFLAPCLPDCGRLQLSAIVVSFCLLFLPSKSSALDDGEKWSVLPPPVFSSPSYPCAPCHQDAAATASARSNTSHALVRVEGHTEGDYGCTGCHAAENPGDLSLFNGRRIAFAEGHELCRQCHAARFQQWRAGLHGKVLGRWDGPGELLSCSACHDPHRPRFRPVVPAPPPLPPEKTLRWRR